MQNILDDPNTTICLVGPPLNEWYWTGTPFRDAYKKMGQESTKAPLRPKRYLNQHSRR